MSPYLFPDRQIWCALLLYKAFPLSDSSHCIGQSFVHCQPKEVEIEWLACRFFITKETKVLSRCVPILGSENHTRTFLMIGLFKSSLLNMILSDAVEFGVKSEWLAPSPPLPPIPPLSLFVLSNHEMTRSGTNCAGTATPNTFLVGFIESVVSVGNWSKFNRNADTGDRSSTKLLPLKNWLIFMVALLTNFDLFGVVFVRKFVNFVLHWISIEFEHTQKQLFLHFEKIFKRFCFGNEETNRKNGK